MHVHVVYTHIKKHIQIDIYTYILLSYSWKMMDDGKIFIKYTMEINYLLGLLETLL